MAVRTCREYRAALAAGLYPLTNFDIKMAAYFSSLNAVLAAVARSKLPLVSYVSSPYCGVADLELLPTTLLPVIGPREDYPQECFRAASLADLVARNQLRIANVSSRRLQFEWHHGGAVLIELLRADLDEDGIEDLLIQHYTYAVGGTLGYGSIGVLRRTGPSEQFTYE